MIVPYISREDVRAALGSLIHHSHRLETNNLRHLLLVDLLITAPHMPDSDAIRDYSVRELLVSQITQVLDEQRAIFNLEPVDERAGIDAVSAEAEEVIAQSAPELMVWSLLYYRYVRSDLAFSVEKLAELLALHSRTIPRYDNDGVDMLTARLIDTEQQVRREQNGRRLYAMLPYSVPVRLIGRDDLLLGVEKALNRLSPRHLLITGALGLGKTTFVQEVVRRQIAADKLDQVVWIDHPESALFVRQRITEALLREGGEVSLRDYLLIYRVAIVLDGIADAAADHAAFNELLRDLGAGLVFLINRVYIPLQVMEAHIPLPELDSEDATDLIDVLLPSSNSDYKQQMATALYDHVGGNPLALKLAAGLWEAGDDWTSVQHELHEQTLVQLYAHLNEEMLRAWCVLALYPNFANPDALVQGWGIPLSALTMLRRHGLVEGNSDTGFSLVEAARSFIHQQYVGQGKERQLMDELVEQLPKLDGAFELIEQVLATDFPEIGSERRTEWVSSYFREGLRRNHWALWRVILEPYATQTGMAEAGLQIAYGMCLRRLSDWDAAAQVFQNVVTETGRAGRFDEQGRALVEWSILTKYQGDFKQAQEMIVQAKQYAQRARDDDLLSSLRLQEAQHLIQHGDGAEAHRLLVMLPESSQILALQGEAQLALGNYEGCRVFARRAITLLADDLSTEASLYTMIGRSFQEQGALSQAQQHLTYAVNLLERSGDTFSLARAQTNLAAALIPLGRLTDANLLLTQAEQVQVRLSDRVGLTATRHNRTLLGRHFAN